MSSDLVVKELHAFSHKELSMGESRTSEDVPILSKLNREGGQQHGRAP
jgi:hypothetical protein